MTTTLITPSKRAGSSTDALARAACDGLGYRNEPVIRVDLCDLDLNALAAGMHGACPPVAAESDSQVTTVQRHVIDSDQVVVVTPIYHGAVAGVVKLFLDSLPQGGLAGKRVLPLGSAGTYRHCLALSYTLVPVLQELGVYDVLKPLCVGPADWSPAVGERCLCPETRTRLAARLDLLVGHQPVLRAAR